MRISIYLALAAATILAACSSNPKTLKFSSVAPPESQSVLYLFNTCYQDRGWSWGPEIYVNNKKRPRLDNQYFQRVVLEPGTHKVRIGPNWNLRDVPDLHVDIDMQAGEDYFVQSAIVNVESSWGWNGNPVLNQSLDWEMRQVPKDQAQNYLQHCHIKE